MRKITKRSAAIVAAAVVAVGGAGAAWAAWSLSGTGSASASAGAVVPLTVTGSPVVDALVPGSKSDVTFTVKNENSFPVLIDSVTYGSFTSSLPSCASDIQAVAGAPLPTDLSVPANATKSFTYEDSLKLIANSADECQNKTFGFSVIVGAKSAAS